LNLAAHFHGSRRGTEVFGFDLRGSTHLGAKNAEDEKTAQEEGQEAGNCYTENRRKRKVKETNRRWQQAASILRVPGQALQQP
jgi:hypothetical protein